MVEAPGRELRMDHISGTLLTVAPRSRAPYAETPTGRWGNKMRSGGSSGKGFAGRPGELRVLEARIAKQYLRPPHSASRRRSPALMNHPNPAFRIHCAQGHVQHKKKDETSYLTKEPEGQ
eukprot:gene7061-biopygen1777